MGILDKENGMHSGEKNSFNNEIKDGIASIASGIERFSNSNLTENNGEHFVYSNVYTEKARNFNRELDAIANEFGRYASDLHNLLGVVKENFPEEQNFTIGISNVIQEIGKEISNFNTSIEGMKNTSLTKARSKDQQMNWMKQMKMKKRENDLIN